ncbi:TPA: hypothetical protein RRF23_003539 [Klebsiella pneumoniae]|nr:hypothetical protein [Klebsiella pneumoniae]
MMADEDHPTSHYFQKRLSQLKVWEFCLTFMANGVKIFARLSTAYFVYRLSPYLPVQKRKPAEAGFLMLPYHFSLSTLAKLKVEGYPVV